MITHPFSTVLIPLHSAKRESQLELVCLQAVWLANTVVCHVNSCGVGVFTNSLELIQRIGFTFRNPSSAVNIKPFELSSHLCCCYCFSIKCGFYSCITLTSCNVLLTFRCLWMWWAISNMSSDWMASISCLRRDNARTDGWMDKRKTGKQCLCQIDSFVTILISEWVDCRAAVIQSNLPPQQWIPTFALEKEIRHRQALSWASSFSRLRVSFLLTHTHHC